MGSNLESLLFEVADRQQGYFTARQAIDIGYHRNALTYFVKVGKWIREARGIYRLANYPLPHRPDLVLWYLWSCNRKGTPQGVYSHDTALDLYDLCDINPSRLHMTVPKTFRRKHSIPKILRLHRGEFFDGDITSYDGVKVTSLVRTLLDLIRSQTISEDLIDQAISQAKRKGVLLSFDKMHVHPLVDVSERFRKRLMRTLSRHE